MGILPMNVASPLRPDLALNRLPAAFRIFAIKIAKGAKDLTSSSS
jgi:hypothetical protein